MERIIHDRSEVGISGGKEGKDVMVTGGQVL